MVLYDPGNFTPYYNDELAAALTRAGMRVSLIASAPLFEKTAGCQAEAVDRHWLFFPGLAPGTLRTRRLDGWQGHGNRHRNENAFRAGNDRRFSDDVGGCHLRARTNER